MRSLALIFALLPLPALAQCPAGGEIFSCTADKKVIEVCTSKGAVTYSYGKPGKPDLTLSVPLSQADYTPWPGVGRSIWDAMAFHNNGFTYEVWASFDKLDENALWEGGVNVLKGEAIQARILCNKGSVTGDLSGLFNAKEGVGQCWNFTSLAWQAAPCD